ncbi:MAG: leucine-rich repeat protein [Clostridiales bacterium]|nr:leucine-rich repeat protein [Clostridiales bacterium]
MKQGKKIFKTITAILTVALLATIGASVLFKDSVRADSGEGWEYDESTYVLTILDESAFDSANSGWKKKQHSIKEIIISNEVSTIPDNAFSNFSNLTSVSLGESVSSIGAEAFLSCSRLTSINLDSVSSIGQQAFNSCTKLETVDLSSATTIGTYAFYQCTSLTTVILNLNLTSIPDGVFSTCGKLSTIDLRNIVDVGYESFYGCKSLTDVDLRNVETLNDRAFLGCRNIELLDLPKAKTIGDMAFFNCGELKTVTLEQTEVVIGEQAFYSCTDLTDISLENVSVIGGNAFQLCVSLQNADLFNVKSLGDGAFKECSGLTNLSLGENLTVIPDEAFAGCTSLTEVDLTFVESLGGRAFRGCSSLETVLMGVYISEIPFYAFDGCEKMKSIDLSNVEILGEYCFNDCYELATVVMSEQITDIPECAFQSCMKLQIIDLSNVTSIDHSAFNYCEALATVNLSNIVCIGSNAFTHCISLTSIDISSVESLGGYAFSYCNSLYSVKFSNKLEDLGENVFYYDTLSKIYYDGTKRQFDDVFDIWYFDEFDYLTIEFGMCEISFDIQDFEYYDIQVVTKGDKATKPEDPTAEDLTFVGWFTDIGCKNLYDFEAPVTKDITLYAGWMKENDDPAAVFKGHSLSLEGDIGVKFYVVLPEGTSSDAYMEFTVEGVPGDKIVSLKDAQTTTVNGVTYKVFKCGVPAKNMTSVIHAELKENNVILATNEYTVREYAKYIIDHQDQYDGALIRLVKDMVNYGAAAQTYFDHKAGKEVDEENLANSFLPQYERGVRYFVCSDCYDPYDDCYLPEGLRFSAVNLSLKSNTVLKMYFEDDYDREVKFYYNGEELEQQESNGRKMIQITGIPAHMLREDFVINIEAEVYDEEEYDYYYYDDYYVVYSPVYYCHDIITADESMSDDFKNVMRHFYLYSGSALQYAENY